MVHVTLDMPMPQAFDKDLPKHKTEKGRIATTSLAKNEQRSI